MFGMHWLLASVPAGPASASSGKSSCGTIFGRMCTSAISAKVMNPQIDGDVLVTWPACGKHGEVGW